MNDNQKNVANLVAYDLFNVNMPFHSSTYDWEGIVLEAMRQGVFLIVYDAIKKMLADGSTDISTELVEMLRKRALEKAFSNIEKIRLQKAFLDTLRDKNIPVCVLKGTSLSINYPNPDLRPLGDLDIYAEPKNVEAIKKILLDMGYEYDKTNTQYHSAFVKGFYEIEVHISLAGMPSGNTRSKLLFVKDMCERSIEVNNKYGRYNIPCACDNGIVQLLHILHHTAERGMNMRLLCDWMMFVDKHMTDDVWESEVVDVYDEIGLSQFAKVVTKLCKEKLGFNNEHVTWCDDVPTKYCEPLWNHIFAEPEEPKTKANKKKFKPAIPEHTLRTDEWEYRSAKGKFYYLGVAKRNIIKIIKGDRSLREFLYLYNFKKKTQKRFVDYHFFDKKTARDYAM